MADQFVIPAAIKRLGPDVTEQVTALMRDAERRQFKEGAEAAETALGIVPRPLRPLVRKAIGL